MADGEDEEGPAYAQKAVMSMSSAPRSIAVGDIGVSEAVAERRARRVSRVLMT